MLWSHDSGVGPLILFSVDTVPILLRMGATVLWVEQSKGQLWGLPGC